jgi:hypothetical protein
MVMIVLLLSPTMIQLTEREIWIVLVIVAVFVSGLEQEEEVT